MNFGVGIAEALQGAQFESIGGFGWMLLKTALILLFVCLLAYLLIRLVLRRLMPGARWSAHQEGCLVLLERLALEPRRSLYVVRAGSKVLLLAVAEGQVTLIAQLDPEDWVENGACRQGEGRHFKEVLGRVLERETLRRHSEQQDDVVSLRSEESEVEKSKR